MANVLTVVWFLVFYVVSLTATLVWVNFMTPGPVARARERVERAPRLHFFLGLGFLVLTFVVASTLIGKGRHGGVQLLGWIMIGPMLAGSVVGNAAIAGVMGERLRASMRTDSPILALIGGALCTVFGGIVPIVGWFVFAPVVGLTALGAGTMGILGRERKAKALPVAQAVPAAPYVPAAPAPASPINWAPEANPAAHGTESFSVS